MRCWASNARKSLDPGFLLKTAGNCRKNGANRKFIAHLWEIPQPAGPKAVILQTIERNGMEERGVNRIQSSKLPGRPACSPFPSSAKSRRWSIERGISLSTDQRPAGTKAVMDRSRSTGAVPPSPRLRPCRKSLKRPARVEPAGRFIACGVAKKAGQRNTSSRRLGGKIRPASSSRYSRIWPFSAKPMTFDRDLEASSRGA